VILQQHAGRQPVRAHLQQISEIFQKALGIFGGAGAKRDGLTDAVDTACRNRSASSVQTKVDRSGSPATSHDQPAR